MSINAQDDALILQSAILQKAKQYHQQGCFLDLTLQELVEFIKSEWEKAKQNNLM